MSEALGSRRYIPRDGGTLRDEFAIAALNGIIVASFGTPTDEDRPIEGYQRRVAEWAYGFADAMLKAREAAQ